MPKPHRPTVQAPGVHHFAVGDILVTALNDGMFEGSFGLLAAFDAPTAERLHQETFRAIPPKLAVNCFLLWTADRLVLVDGGCGNAFGSQLGRMAGWLRAVGVAPADIDTVLLTHMHADHVGGLVDTAGAAVFPHAELVLHEVEAAFWSDEATLAGAATESEQSSIRRARTTLAAYDGRTRRLTRGEALAGVSILPEPGHTPGHSGWLVSSGAASLLIWGDIVHLPGVQFTHPEAGMTYDIDGAQAIPTRRRVLDMVATDRLAVAGMHLDFPTFGHVVRQAEGYAFVPEVWRPDI
ncbi:MAG: MBL fold metallo-hydrolase [Acetobacteraceae bacterium]|nr:MBL fold metallo-hydrolase [Acetobacteraceae bacterium]